MECFFINCIEGTTDEEYFEDYPDEVEGVIDEILLEEGDYINENN